MRRFLSIPVVLAAAACSGTGDATRFVAVVTELESPAEVGSGEPFLSSAGDGIHMSWLQESAAGGHDLRVARHGGAGWSAPNVVAHRDDFFVNWADFPSVVADASGRLWAHWLQRGPAGGYDYGIRLVSSTDGGDTWSEPWTPHEDGTPTEHGFVSLLPWGEGIALSWLDGRKVATDADGRVRTQEMTVRFRTVDGAGVAGPEVLLDGRACDCCQTSTAMAAAGPVVVYRDRSEDEIRDIYITRWVDGSWTEPAPVGRDGWHIGGCPVNGPAVEARGDTVVVAWFTGAENQPVVKAAYSVDGGASFGEPLRVDDGNPAGRVDLVLRPGGEALVSWLERTGEEEAEIRLRRIRPEGSDSGAGSTLAVTSGARASGFPRIVEEAPDALLLAWTEVTDEGARVRVARVEIGG